MMQIIARAEESIFKYFSSVAAVNREFVRAEAAELKTLLSLIRVRWNTGRKWTRGESREFRMHFKGALKVIYALIIFLLPGGLLLLPFAAGWLHRSKV